MRVGEGAFAVPDVSGSGSGGGRGRGSAIGVGKENVGVVRERRTGEKREVGEMAQAALGLGSAGEKGGAGGAKVRSAAGFSFSASPFAALEGCADQSGFLTHSAVGQWSRKPSQR